MGERVQELIKAKFKNWLVSFIIVSPVVIVCLDAMGLLAVKETYMSKLLDLCHLAVTVYVIGNATTSDTEKVKE